MLRCQRVSILVLVDVALRPSAQVAYPLLRTSFNPCFSGCCSSTVPSAAILPELIGFNPCFSGCCSSTIYNARGIYTSTVVSILVLVDVALRRSSLLIEYLFIMFQSLF